VASVAEIADAMKTVLSIKSEEMGRSSGFVQRVSKLTAAVFVQTLVLGWLKRPSASLSHLSQTAASLGVPVSEQGLDERFGAPAVKLMALVLSAALECVLVSKPVAIALLQRVNGVYLQDSSVVNLPDDLASAWKGCGGTHDTHPAALKLNVRLNLVTGQLEGPLCTDGKAHDRRSPLQHAPLPPQALRIADLGFFSLACLGAIAAAGAFFLSRLFRQTKVFDAAGASLPLLPFLQHAGPQVDRDVLIGAKDRLAVRLLAQRVPPPVAAQRRAKIREDARRRHQKVSAECLALADWTLLVTHVPRVLLSLTEALVLLRIRWQIELLFKLWKSVGLIDEWRTGNSQRILCEIYAKLIGVIIQNWLLLTDFWALPDKSWTKAAQVVRAGVALLESAVVGVLTWEAAITQLQRGLQAGCRMNSRRVKPNAYQLLLAFPEVP
jgi:hypothetical protein